MNAHKPSELQRKYTALHKQGWLPIFVADRFDALTLAEACVEAGLQAIEVTCRRQGAAAEISAIKQRFPELIVLAGSVVDDPKLLAYLRRKRPDMPSVEQLCEAGVDGLVSIYPLTDETLRTHARERICIPGVETLGEAVHALHQGAHFTKFFGVPPERVKQLTSDPTHKLLPIFYTGGASLERIPAYVASGAVIVGGGWDLMLGEDYDRLQRQPNTTELAARLSVYKRRMDEAKLAAAALHAEDDDLSYLEKLPHYHPW